MLCAAHAHASLDDVLARARTLADQPYRAPANNLPPAFRQMQFADYIKIQPRRDQMEWKDQGTPFRLAFYHRGMQFSSPVRINEIVGGAVQEIRYDPPASISATSSSTNRPPPARLRRLPRAVPDQPGRQGRRDHERARRQLLPRGRQGPVYGLSGRGLAIDTGLPVAEEFPAFREFWLVRPAARDKQLVFYALLDSARHRRLPLRADPRPHHLRHHPQGTGAHPDAWPRGQLGVAPLTSMFLFGPNQQRDPTTTARPCTTPTARPSTPAAAEWLWRPLNNPRQLAISTFQVTNPRGFGLLQRGRAFSAFET